MNTVRLLQAGDVPGVAALLARALGKDPAYAVIFPDAAKRERPLADLFARNLRIHLPYRCTHVLVGGEDTIGTVTVRPPSGVPITTLTKIRHGLLPFTFLNGLRATKRLLAIADFYDRVEREIAPTQHWHVHMMAIEPAVHGRGFGSVLLREVLARTQRQFALPTVLTTHSEENVGFYRRFGFDVTEKRAGAPARSPYDIWCMRRPAP